MSNHEEWLRQVSGGASKRRIAAAADIPQTTFNRQVNEGSLDADSVIAVARAFDTNPVAALVATGHISAAESGGASLEEVAALLPDQALIRLLASRIDANPASWEGTFDDVVNESDNDEFSRRRNGRSRTSTPDVQDDIDDALIKRINDGTEPVAAQEATDPIEEEFS